MMENEKIEVIPFEIREIKRCYHCGHKTRRYITVLSIKADVIDKCACLDCFKVNYKLKKPECCAA